MNALIQNNRFFKRINSGNAGMGEVLLLSCLFSISLSVFRILYTGSPMFVFLSWNLFLAAVPYFLTESLMRRPEWIERKWIFGGVFCAWLLFIPNSFYIITDLFHLEKGTDVPQWFDLALILSFAWNGLLLGVLSVLRMELIVKVRLGMKAGWPFIYPLMFLNAFGIYLGRYLRYNSWDIVTDPFSLFENIVLLLLHPLRHRLDWSMIICYAALMTIMYLSVKKLRKAG